MTLLDIRPTLVASHIKPWVVSNNEERLSVENDLLLSATYDRLFDSGLISFDDNDKIKISSMINDKNKNNLKLNKDNVYDIKYNPNMHQYLEYYR